MVRAWQPELVSSPLLSLSRLSCLDLGGTGRELCTLISPAALAALSPLPLTALRATVECTGLEPAREVLASVAGACPALQRLLLGFSFLQLARLDRNEGILRPLSALTSLRALSLEFWALERTPPLEPLAALPRLEHLSVAVSDGFDLRPIASLTALRSLALNGKAQELSFLAPLTRLEALRLLLITGDALESAARTPLLALAPRLRCLDISSHCAGAAAAGLAAALQRFTALQDATLDLTPDCLEALARLPLAPSWAAVRSLQVDVADRLYRTGVLAIPAPLISSQLFRPQRIASDLTGLRMRELTLGDRLPVPVPADFAAGLRGRLRRLRADPLHPLAWADEATRAVQRAQLAALGDALGLRVEPLHGH
eukprot:tig00021108_g18293.t1